MHFKFTSSLYRGAYIKDHSKGQMLANYLSKYFKDRKSKHKTITPSGPLYKSFDFLHAS